MHFVMSQMAGPSILAQSEALLYGLFRFAGKKHKSPLENIGEERKLGLKIQDNKRFFRSPRRPVVAFKGSDLFYRPFASN